MAELGFKSFIQRKHQLISGVARQWWLARVKKLVVWVKRNPASTVQIFSDKKVFTVDQFHNRRNDHWMAIDRGDMEFICTTKQPQQMMVLGILVSDGKRIPLSSLPRTKSAMQMCTTRSCGARSSRG